jgi:two-component system response regulator
MRNRPARILLAEDDRTTASLIKIALLRTGVSHDLDMVHDGDSAIAALESPDAAADLLLLDLQMPGKNGFEVLQHVKGQERLRRIPIVMFSSSASPNDVNRAYDLHVNAYVLKRPDFSELCRSLDGILQFWLRTAMIPIEPRKLQ